MKENTTYRPNQLIRDTISSRKDQCKKCAPLFELYEQTPKTNRDYWLMTEVFVFLHGGDICNG